MNPCTIELHIRAESLGSCKDVIVELAGTARAFSSRITALSSIVLWLVGVNGNGGDELLTTGWVGSAGKVNKPGSEGVQSPSESEGYHPWDSGCCGACCTGGELL